MNCQTVVADEHGAAPSSQRLRARALSFIGSLLSVPLACSEREPAQRL